MNESQVLVPEGQNYFQIVRTFDAPRALVYRCYTDPVHMAHFWGPHDATTTSRVDLKPGGVWRTDWRYPDGNIYGYTSVYLELVPPERIVYRDAPADWQGGLEGLPPTELHSTIELNETDGRTTVTVTVRCTSVAARDDNVKRGFAGMVNVGHDRLEAYLKTLDPAQA
jgi:uncharacterized protein YndB with AHSA1/START domain